MVRADPEPHDVTSVQHSKSPIVIAYPYRINRTPTAHPLEIQTRMIGVKCEEAVGLPRLPLNVIREEPICIPETSVRKRAQVYKSSMLRG